MGEKKKKTSRGIFFLKKRKAGEVGVWRACILNCTALFLGSRCGRVGQVSMAFLILDGREMMVDECKWSFQEENFKESVYGAFLFSICLFLMLSACTRYGFLLFVYSSC